MQCTGDSRPTTVIRNETVTCRTRRRDKSGGFSTSSHECPLGHMPMKNGPDNRPPRILFCTDTYPPQVNGVSVVTALSVSGLRERGWECAVVAPTYPAVLPQGPLPGNKDPELVEVPSVAFPPYPDIRLAAPAFLRVSEAVERF